MQTIKTKVRGLYYNHGFEAIRSRSVTAGDKLRLEREPDSPHGSETTSVRLFGGRGQPIGYVPRGLAPRLSKLIDEGISVVAFVEAIGTRRFRGKQQPTMQMRIEIGSDSEMLRSPPLEAHIRRLTGITGVYSLMCLDSGKRYIGSGLDIGSRLRFHHENLVAGIHSNDKLIDAWNQSTPDSWVGDLVEETAPHERAAREAYWISHYDSCQSGYNLTADGQGHPASAARPSGIAEVEGPKIGEYMPPQAEITSGNQRSGSGCMVVVGICSLVLLGILIS